MTKFFVRVTPTWPVIVPSPIEPTLGTSTVEYIGKNCCVNGESVWVVCPFASVKVIQTDVGYLPCAVDKKLAMGAKGKNGRQERLTGCEESKEED